MVLKPDKGAGVVIVNRSLYLSKIYEILKDYIKEGIKNSN